MPKNTYLLVSFLAVFAALVIGVNFGKIITRGSINQLNQISPSISPTPTEIKVNLTNFENTKCGFTFSYPENLKKMEAADGNTIFIDAKNPDQSVLVFCQKIIPTPKGKLIEKDIKIGSASAQVYEESSDSGKLLTAYNLLVTNPKNNMDILISGLGSAFETIVKSLVIN
jgi:hypothetical protein